MGRVTSRRSVVRVVDGSSVRRQDTLVVEEPLEIRLDGEPLSVTMRTPGDDFDLAIGFLVGEGVIRGTDDVVTARYCAGKDDNGVNSYNVVDVALAPGVARPGPEAARSTYLTSSCGVCGKASLDAVRVATPYDIGADRATVAPPVLLSLPDALRAAQAVFEQTGGLHAAGLFTTDGELLCVREDVGRHNAVDKVVGWAARESRLPLSGHVLQVSGRASFELVQKAALAGIPVLSAVSAPSSLAVDLADECGLSLAGFVRGSSLNVYAHPERVVG
jgi:FdhD protein